MRHFNWVVITYDHRQVNGSKREDRVKNKIICLDYERAQATRDALEMAGQTARVMVQYHLSGHGNVIVEPEELKHTAEDIHTFAEYVLANMARFT